MPLFGRKREAPAESVGVLLLQGHDMIRKTALAHQQRWGLGSAVRWDLDQVDAQLRFTFADYVVAAPVQVLGSYSSAGGTWMWAWANHSLEGNLRVASENVRAWGERHSQAMFISANLSVTQEQAADLAALAFRLSGYSGYYRAPAGSADLHLAFGDVTVIHPDGQREEFRIDVS